MAESLTVSPEELENFFAFLQCQLKKQTLVRCDQEVTLKSQAAKDIWKSFDEWVIPNTRTDKWVPFHTALGAHELFALTDIHALRCGWDDRQRLTALFIFRAHCRPSVFRDTQLPHMHSKDFWSDPCKYFSEKGKILKEMLNYRRAGNSMQTIAFRCIPKRLCEDADENLVINICQRTCTLIEIADRVTTMIKEHRRKKTSSSDLFNNISATIRQGKGMGDTWVKMLMVSVDIAFPELSLLNQHCEVGMGAVRGLQRIIPQLTSTEQSSSKRALEKVVAAVNAAPKKDQPSARGFWDLLPKVEDISRNHYKSYKLMLKQFDTPHRTMSAGTVQVQLCEWRQFHDWLTKKLKPNPQEDSNDLEAKSEDEVEMDDDAPLVKVPVAVAAYALPKCTIPSSSSSSSSSSFSRPNEDVKLEGKTEGGSDRDSSLKRGFSSSSETAASEPGAKRSRSEEFVCGRGRQWDQLVKLRLFAQARHRARSADVTNAQGKAATLKLQLVSKSEQCEKLRENLHQVDGEFKRAVAQEQKLSFEGTRWSNEHEVKTEAYELTAELAESLVGKSYATSSSFYDSLAKLAQAPEDLRAPEGDWVPETPDLQDTVARLMSQCGNALQTHLGECGDRLNEAEGEMSRIVQQQTEAQELTCKLADQKRQLQAQYDALDEECKQLAEEVRKQMEESETAQRDCLTARLTIISAEATLETLRRTEPPVEAGT